MQVKDIMSTNVAACTPDTKLGEVARQMAKCDCGAIPVVENENSKKVVGIVTDRDITCRTVAQGMNPLEKTAGEIMSTDCHGISPDASLEECERLLEQYQVRRAPVVDEQGVCCGIVAQADIARNAPQDAAGEVVKEVSKPMAAAR